MKYTFKGKTGQERKDGKKQGGKAYHLSIPEEEAQKVLAAIMAQTPGKLAQAMFAYGMTSDAQEAIGYEIPGAVEWTEKVEVPVHEWTAEDTADYIEALTTYAAMPRENGFSLETRQAAWDKKYAEVTKLTQDTAMIQMLIGKRPEAKA